MPEHAVVLGCGLVGATMARDMASDYRVTACDLKKENLDRLAGTANITTEQIDLSNAAKIREAIEDADVVLGAMPSVLGFQTLRTVIEAGKPYSDISFMPEDALELDDLAQSKGVTAVVDCGVSPGLSNLAVGHAGTQLAEVHSAVIYVGGLPKARHWPYQYKAPFAPSDVIEEYTRPARLVENGRLVTKPALSEPELIDFPGIGSLEAFNTDGLRSLIRTLNIPNMKEKTLRYPGHIELMRAFRETGLFDKNEIEVKGVRVRPLDVTSRLLFPKWTYESDEEEFTVLRVIVVGSDVRTNPTESSEACSQQHHPSEPGAPATGFRTPCAITEFSEPRMSGSGFSEPGAPATGSCERLASFSMDTSPHEATNCAQLTYDLYDQYDRATKTSSMARTTAFPATITARLLAERKVTKPGVLPPELLAHEPNYFDHMVRELKARNVLLTIQVTASRHVDQLAKPRP